jgi:hypothetical protein
MQIGDLDIMKHAIAHVALRVREYDGAIAFYTEKLGFTRVEETYQAEQDKRWVVIAPACQWSVCKACSSRSCTSSSDVCEKSSYH